jgi:hypothetical protein
VAELDLTTGVLAVGQYVVRLDLRNAPEVVTSSSGGWGYSVPVDLFFWTTGAMTMARSSPRGGAVDTSYRQYEDSRIPFWPGGAGYHAITVGQFGMEFGLTVTVAGELRLKDGYVGVDWPGPSTLVATPRSATNTVWNY